MDIITINGLRKSYKDVVAVDGLSFKVKKGELFAFLGENGAGKSTTINIMCGTESKDAGEIIIDGVSVSEDNSEIKNSLGVVFQSSVLDKNLTVRENLKHRAGLYGILGVEFEKRYNEINDLLNFKEYENRAVCKLSGGQRRKVDIARALIHQPKILVLDEPTTGLDPQTRANIWSVISSLQKDRGITVFLTTHYMEEASDADYIVIIDKGKIACEDTPINLKNKYANDSITVYNVTSERLDAVGLSYEKVGEGYRINVKNTGEATKLITKHPDLFVDYEVVKGKMDSVFLAVTGKKLTGGAQ